MKYYALKYKQVFMFKETEIDYSFKGEPALDKDFKNDDWIEILEMFEISSDEFHYYFNNFYDINTEKYYNKLLKLRLTEKPELLL